MPRSHGTRVRALITGAAGGLGSAFAAALVSRGDHVLLVDRDAESLAAIAAALGRDGSGAVTTCVTDLADRAAVEDLAAGLDVDMLVNNVGFMLGGSFIEHDAARLMRMLDVHVAAAVTLSHGALPAMIGRRQGAIVNVASLGAFEPSAADVLYGATKRFLIHFSLALDGQVRAAGVRVQALCPGLTRTKFHDQSDEGRAMKTMIPPALWMTPEEVVAASLRTLPAGPVVCVPGLKNRLLRPLMKQPRLMSLLFSLLPQRRG
jgi:hypothetical protein